MPLSLGSLAVTLTALLGITHTEAADHSVLDAQHWNELKTGTPLSWPALRFHFSLKKDTMKVYGMTTFDMYANPIVLDNNKNVLYDAYATFTDSKGVHNYTLVNGVPYSESTPFTTGSSSGTPTPLVACLDAEFDKLPELNSIVAAVNAVTVSGSGSAASACSTGSSYKTAMKGVDYAVCVSGTTGFTVQGSDMDVSVEYLESHIEIQRPTMDPKAQKCASKASSTSTTSIGHALLTGAPIPTNKARNLEAELSIDISLDELSTCSCKSTPRPCIFIHGQGIEPEMAENQDKFSKYWGNLTDHAPCCSSMKYARLETIHSAWSDPSFQQKVCDRALAVSDSSSTSAIADTIVVTHSMGNLMFAGALANGLCELDSSSTWVGLAGPMKGSMASDFVQDSCAGETSVILEKFGEITGKCPPKGSIKSLAYEGESYSSTKLDAAYKAAQKAYQENVYALMCGDSYSGLLSSYQAKFWLLGGMIPHKSDLNDGMVEFQSCAVGFPEEKFGDSYRDRFYRNKLNHFDMEFLAGDSVLNEAKMPVRWFECLL
ncbi:hypothetical protein PHYPSEUDO_014384 [Phytophthora pseudosyringae]|uniref:Uncharacterized protein n=1 Tax=Phytophthora pseudosyringae TaxID=221518 RepID=A0A8T1W599_9STRA|nr:hypothetical protein PHYPSEUDO_014384 [Phytophthora pseudosyringae]